MMVMPSERNLTGSTFELNPKSLALKTVGEKCDYTRHPSRSVGQPFLMGVVQGEEVLTE
jgi:hypothetical protein